MVPLEKLRTTLADLERQLRELGTVDDESRRVLEQAVDDIHAVLRHRGESTVERQSLIERLRTAVERFQGSHPVVTGTLIRLIDGLGEMGI